MKCLRCSRLWLLFLVWILAGGVGKVQAIGIWHRDYAAARNEAKTEGKNLLIVFTGTDWIEICAKFYDEILGQPEFIDTVSAKYALLKLEYPKDNQLPREEAAQKALLREAYRVRGFPTVVLTDADGRPFGINGFQPVPPKQYAEQLLGITTLNEEGIAAIQKAETLTGEEKAKSLNRGIPDLPGALVARFYRKEMEAVLAADPDDTLKLREPFQRLLADADYARALMALARESKWTEMIALTDQHLAAQKFEGDELQSTLINRAGFELRAGQKETYRETLQKAVEIDPKSQQGLEAARLLAGGRPNEDTDTAPIEPKAEGELPVAPRRAVPVE